MDEQAIPRDQIEAIFKSIKKEMDAAFIKIYDDGGVKVIDNYGVIINYDTYNEFLKFARKKFGVGV